MKSAERQPDVTAPSFLKQEIAWLRGLIVAMLECDVTNDLDFSFFIQRVATPEATGLEQKKIASQFMISAMTLQRWARCEHLPYPLPRRGYLDGLTKLVERRIEALELHGVHALLATPRRGARRPTSPPGAA